MLVYCSLYIFQNKELIINNFGQHWLIRHEYNRDCDLTFHILYDLRIELIHVLGETSTLIGCSLNIQQPAAANLYTKCYILLLNAAAFWLQPAVIILMSSLRFVLFEYEEVRCKNARVSYINIVSHRIHD